MNRLHFPSALALVMIAAPATSQTRPAPAGQPGPSHPRFARHPFTSALDALTNYQSCGVDLRTAALARLDAAFRASEAAARAKGLGPLLDDLRRDYLALLAVSTRTA